MFFSDTFEFVPLFTEKQMESLLPEDTKECILSFNKGYERGLTWPDEWKHHGAPGGPWVYSGSNKERHEQSSLENKLWRFGYNEGRKLNP